MKRLARSRPSPAMVVAVIALFVALGGGATAAALITGAQIKNNTVSSADLKNNSARSKDIKNESLRTQDIRNGSLLAEDFKAGQLPAGAEGPAGPQGPVGPLLDTLPSGKTLRGVYDQTFTATDGAQLGSSQTITYQLPLPSGPTVNFIAAGGVPPAACPGTTTAPEAAAGHLCIYESNATNHGTPLIANPATNTTTPGSLGFRIVAPSSAAGLTVSRGSWAVTAP